MKDIIDGAKQLLRESIKIIDKSVNDIIFVGGWGPYIRHTDRHPGTRDVDILFPEKYSKDDMVNILNRFLENGYFVSAKHDFQLCRAIKLGNQTYIYNVDLLHPTEGKMNKVDFVEIMDLDVTDGIRVKSLLSINIQYGSEIYSNELYESVTFEGNTFKVLDGAGIIISKLNSAHNKKRLRDIFDIYLSLEEKGSLEKLLRLGVSNPSVQKNIEDFNTKVLKDWGFYDDSLKKFGIENPSKKHIILEKK